MRTVLFGVSLLTYLLPSACGLRLQDAGQAEQVLIPVADSAKQITQKAIKVSEEEKVYSEFYFGRSPAVSSLIGDTKLLVYSGKMAETEVIISMSDGSMIVFDEVAKKTKKVAVAEAQTNNLRRIVFPKGEVWSLSDKSLTHTQPVTDPFNGSADASAQQITKSTGDFVNHNVLHAAPNRLITKSPEGLNIISFNEKRIALATFSADSTLGKVAGSAIAAGFTPSDEKLWLVTPSHVYFFKRAGGGFGESPVTAKMKLGLPESEAPLRLAIHFSDELKIQGQVVLFSQSGVFISGQIPADVNWDSHIKPLSEKYCIGCHSSTVGSFGKADVQASWTSSKAKISERIFSNEKPMPPNYSNLSLSELEKKTIESWIKQTGSSDVTVDIGATPTPTPVAVVTPVPLPPISPSFGPNEILSGIETVMSDVLFISKDSSTKTVFSMNDGSAYVYDEGLNRLSSLPAPLVPVSETKTYLVGPLNGWRISSEKVESFAPAVSPVGAENLLSMISVDYNSTNDRILHVSKNLLILKSSTALVFFTRTPDTVFREDLVPTYLPALSVLLPEIRSAGFGPGKSFLWVATAKKVFFFENTVAGFEKNPSVANFYSGLTGGAEPSILSVEFGDNKSVAGRIVYAAGNKVYVSGFAPAAAPLLWEVDVRPIAEQHCLSCHGASGAGGFSNADQAASWTGVKRNSIISRVVDQKTMPPVNSAPANAMTDQQREIIRVWLSGAQSAPPSPAEPVAGATPSPTPSPTPIPEATPITPGPTWTNIVLPIIQNRCARCHSTYTSFNGTLGTYENRSKIILSVENGSMPRSGSPEREAMTQQEINSLLSYLKGLP